LDVYADLFDENLDGVADRLDAFGRGDPRYCGRSADGLESLVGAECPDLRKRGGAKGIRTPDLLDATESRYQLRHSPWSLAGYQPTGLARKRRYCPEALGRW